MNEEASSVILEGVLNSINNWFDVSRHFGSFTISGGGITLPFLSDGQYFRIVGSVFNDGLHEYPATELTDETFDGAVWALAVPRAVVELAAEIEAWQEKNGDAAASPYQSESFGGYQYSKAADAKTGGALTWEGAFRARLNQWRKL